MKAIGYVRVSSLKQAEEGVSLSAQRERISAWCTANDVDLIDIFEDSGISGARADNRPALNSALDSAVSLRAVLVVHSLSRLARSTIDAIAISERLSNAGADLVSLSERIDTTTAAGKMVFRMLAVLAEFERDQISERTSAAMRHKIALGKYIGGGIPYGYKLVDGQNLVKDEDEQRVVRKAIRLRDSGHSLRSVSQTLAEQGIVSRTGRVFQAVQIQSMIKMHNLYGPALSAIDTQ